MGQVIEAIYDGAVFRPTVPVTLKPNTRVRVTVARDVGTSAPGDFFPGHCEFAQPGWPHRLGRQLGGEFMSPELIAVVEPFVRRGLFPNAEMAVAEIAGDYVLRQIERYRADGNGLSGRVTA